MISQRQLFFKHVGQTSEEPLALEIVKAEDIYIIDKQGKKYIDLVAGVSVSNLGHNNKVVIKAIKKQLKKYMHLMVYGEYIQSPQVKFAQLLSKHTPDNLESVYFVNSGSEAIEGAMKLAKRYTHRTEIIAFKNAYHGSTHGAMSLMSDNTFSQAYRPLLPDIKFLDFNKSEQLNKITEKTAGVVVEIIQGEAGVIPAKREFIKKLSDRCKKTGTLLIIDEIQTGFGRSGKLFAFQNYDIKPDIIAMAKAMGGGMPIGGFMSSKKIMDSFTNNPVLGHITTFGGHPVSAAAAYASLKFLLKGNLMKKVNEKEKLFRENLQHKNIKSITGQGLLLACELGTFEKTLKFIDEGAKLGFVSDWFLFEDTKFRISPPLTITKKQILETCKLINKALDNV